MHLCLMFPPTLSPSNVIADAHDAFLMVNATGDGLPRDAQRNSLHDKAPEKDVLVFVSTQGLEL